MRLQINYKNIIAGNIQHAVKASIQMCIFMYLAHAYSFFFHEEYHLLRQLELYISGDLDCQYLE